MSNTDKSTDSGSAQDDSGTPQVTFGPSAAETIIEQFGWRVDGQGYIASDDGQSLIKATDGDIINIDELAGIVPGEDGEPTPLRDDFNSIVEHVKRRQNNAK